MLQSVRTGGKDGGVDGDGPQVTISRRRTLAEMERLDVNGRNRRPGALNTIPSPSSSNPSQSMRSPSHHKQPPYQAAQLSPVAARRNLIPQQNTAPQRAAPSPRGRKPPISPPSPKPPALSAGSAAVDVSVEPSAHNAPRRFSSCPVRSEAQRLPQSPTSDVTASAPAAAAISSFPLVGMWAKQSKKPAAVAEGGSGISAPPPAGGSARREDRAGNELLRPSASGNAGSGSRSGRNISATSGRCSPRVGDSCAISEETTDGKRRDAANGAVTDGSSDGGDSDDEFVDLYWTALEHRKAANAALSTALNRLGVGAGGAKAEACFAGGSARNCGRGNDAEGLGGRRRRSSSWGNLADSHHPLQGGQGDGSGRFARRQAGQGHRRRHSITCIDTELKEFLDLVDQEDDVDEFISTRVIHLPAPLSTATDPLVPAPYSTRAAATEGIAGNGKTPAGSNLSSPSSVVSTALTPLAPDDLPLGYSASSPTPLSPASLISPSASPLSSPSATAAAVAGFPRHVLASGSASNTPKGGAVAARAAAGGARRGGCAGGDSSRASACVNWQDLSSTPWSFQHAASIIVRDRWRSTRKIKTLTRIPVNSNLCSSLLYWMALKFILLISS
ncbi:unnamed protein product [Closterium sp. Yama58-4]|nr:unnamed protein product [Closterium sp. Yama58-4]